jgi:hypothetical protein
VGRTRLVASFVLATRSNGLSDDAGRDVAVACAHSYRQTMLKFSEMDVLETWYNRLDERAYLAMLPQSQKSVLRKRIDKAAAHGSHERVFPKLVKQDGGPLRIVAAGIPALIPRLQVPGVVLEIVIGVIVGSQVLGWVYPGVALNFLANFGVGMLFLAAGFEMDPDVLRGAPIRNAVAGWRPSRDWCPSGHRVRVHATAPWSPPPVAPSAWGPIGIIPRRRPFIT